jgi:hypothetical protein
MSALPQLGHGTSVTISVSPEIPARWFFAIAGLDHFIDRMTTNLTRLYLTAFHEHDVTLLSGEDVVAMAKQIYGDNYEQKTFSFVFRHRMTK